MLKWLNFICVLFFGFESFSQKPMVQLIVDPKVIQIGEEITVTVKTNVSGNINVDLPQAFVSSNSFMKASSMETDYTTGKMILSTYSSQTGVMSKEGTFTFGPAYVKKGNKVYKSNIVIVKVEKDRPINNTNEVSNKQMKQPAFGIIEKSKSKIYEGEPIVIAAKIYSRFEPIFLEGYQTYELEGALEKHELGNNQNIGVEEKNIKGLRMFYFEYDKQLIFPTEIGKNTIKPFKINLKSDFDGYAFTSNGATFEVMPLPKNAPNDFTGGVGRFMFTRKIENKSYKQGDVFEIKITVKGEGNIHNIDAPKLSLPKSMVQYGDPIINNNFTFGNNGAEGEITYIYNVQITQSGIITIPSMSLSYFDPIKEQYITLKEQAEEIKVDQNASFVTPNNTPSNLNNGSEEVFSGQPNIENRKLNKSIVYNKYFWGAIGTPIFLGLLFFLLRHKKEKSINRVEEVIKKPFDLNLIEDITHSKLKDLKLTIENKRYGDAFLMIPTIFSNIARYSLDKEEGIIISKFELFDFLKSIDLPENVSNEIKSLLSRCEEARYGLGINEITADELHTTTSNLALGILNCLKDKTV
ncbi:MAG: BatD family protein [Flavobacteriia bacterium]|nr:BatD family protein [Flavobacteriia bacterium]